MTVGPLYIIWPFNFRPQRTLWFTRSLESFWEVFLENLWSSEEMKQDFEVLPIPAPLKRQSEEKNGGDYVSNKHFIILMTLSPIRDLKTHTHWGNWGTAPCIITLQWSGKLVYNQVSWLSGWGSSFPQLIYTNMFYSVLYWMNVYWTHNYGPSSRLGAGKSMRSQNVSWFLPLWLRKKLVGRGSH